MRKVIEVRNLYKLYRVGDEFVRALDGVDFEIYEGEFCAIVGTSGSGKSTLLNMLAGLEKPTKGEVIIAGTHEVCKTIYDHPGDLIRRRTVARITAAPGSGQHLRPRSYADRFTDRYTSTQCSK